MRSGTLRSDSKNGRSNYRRERFFITTIELINHVWRVTVLLHMYAIVINSL